MVSRYYVRCPGCERAFAARIGAEPTDLTKFYIPCPYCQLPIRGRMTGQELEEHRVVLDAEIIAEAAAPADARVVTINPFVPSRYDADSHDRLGAFPMMTLISLMSSESLQDFMQDSGAAAAVIGQFWPSTEMLFEYYLDSNWAMFEKVAKTKLELDEVGTTRHERSTVAYQYLAVVTLGVVGQTGARGRKIIDRYSRKHLASIEKESYRTLLRDRDSESRRLEREVFDALSHFIDNYPSWSMGRLVRLVEEGGLDDLTLYRDEFTLVRDLYQQGFELACKCLWLLVAAQNTIKRGDPNLLGEAHPESVPAGKRAKTLTQFDKLPNAYKLAYAGLVPGWDSLSELLSNQRRNTIGHATARHDLRVGRVVSDKDPDGINYLEFLSEVFSVFEALASLMQALRLVRVAASPDFGFNTQPPSA